MTVLKSHGDRDNAFEDSDQGPATLGVAFTRYLERQKKQLEKAHKMQVKNVKAVAM